jgi:hypothetical protein
MPSLPGHYPLPRYYGPVRLPTEPLPRLCFPSERWRRFRRHPAGSPRFLDRSVSTRRPLSPRQAQRLLAPIASSLAAGFITLRRTGRLQVWCNEAETGSLALRLADSPPEASPLGLLPAALGRLSLEWAIKRMNSFQFIRSARLGLAHPRHQRKRASLKGISIHLDLPSCPRIFALLANVPL